MGFLSRAGPAETATGPTSAAWFSFVCYFPHRIISPLAAQCFEGAGESSATEQAIYSCLAPKADFLSSCDVRGPCGYFHV